MLLGYINVCVYALVFAASVILTKTFSASGHAPIEVFGWIYIDSLSVFFLLITSIVTLASSIYSIGYIRRELEDGAISPGKALAYFQLFDLFSAVMLIIPVLNNLALVWIAIEMTTLVSAFLVGFHNDKESVEAAWKYIIICSVGITFALLGIIFFYYTALTHAGTRSLEWAEMFASSGMFDPRIARIALVFIMVGYGTKSGLAPMHNWLPDAHSRAVSPISALLSGVLLKVSLYAMLRFVMLANQSAGYNYSAKLFIVFGLCSVAVAGFFILVQKDLKRLLAYSSVENLGLISLGLGLGASGGVFAAFLHAFNHAITKALMFFCAGNAVSLYRSNNMNKMQGILSAMPFTGSAMFLGLFALVGMPPFSIFISKLLILVSAFARGHYLVGGFTLLFAGMAFAGLVYHITKSILGKEPSDIGRWKEPLSSKAAIIFLGVFILGLGLYLPRSLSGLLVNCQGLILGRL